MGEIADMMIEGILCEQCGVFLEGEPPGYPRLCGDCEKDVPVDRVEIHKKIPCPICKKRVKERGMDQHQADSNNCREIAANL